MKTKSLFAIAIEAVLAVSLIAVLVSLLILVYIVLAIFIVAATQAATAPQLTAPSARVFTAAKPALAPTIYALPEAKTAPQLVDEVQEITEEKTPETVTPTEEIEIIDYAKMTTRVLRPLARDRKIPKWNKLNKKELIAALSA